VHLVRHGEVYNPDGVLYGRLPGFRLSDKGNRQAQAVAEALAVLKPLLEDRGVLKVGQNLKYDVQVLARALKRFYNGLKA